MHATRLVERNLVSNCVDVVVVDLVCVCGIGASGQIFRPLLEIRSSKVELTPPMTTLPRLDELIACLFFLISVCDPVFEGAG